MKIGTNVRVKDDSYLHVTPKYRTEIGTIKRSFKNNDCSGYWNIVIFLDGTIFALDDLQLVEVS